MRRPPSLLLLALAAAPLFAACSSASDARAQDDRTATADVVREGDASAAQLNTFLERKAREWAWAGGQFDAPEDQAALAADTPQTFSWHADPADFAEAGAAAEIVMTHLLEFSTPRNDVVLRVFTTSPTYTPDTVAWRKLELAHEPITVSLTTGSFIGADLPEEGGPFIGQSLTLTIE